MATGSIERLPSGSFRAVVRAGTDPITGKRVKLTETCLTDVEARAARDRMLAQVEAESHPDRAANVRVLMERWMAIADHGLTTRDVTASYVRRVINPALGDMTLRKLQHRVDIIDRLYTHLRRCGALCDGRPFIEHTRAEAHDCKIAKCRPHVCRPMSAATIRRIHGILSPALGYAVSWGWIEKNPAERAPAEVETAAGPTTRGRAGGAAAEPGLGELRRVRDVPLARHDDGRAPG
jgi:integrase